jgi:uncharacterized protein involved in response to NO
VLIWIATRISFFHFQDQKILLILIAPLFLIALLLKMLQVLRGNRNFLIVNSLLFFLIFGQLCYLYGRLYDQIWYAEVGIKLALAVITLFVYTFSGRLIPFFTNSKFKEKLITPNQRLEQVGYLAIILSFLIDIATQGRAGVVCYFLTGVLLLVRSKALFHKKMFEVAMLSPFFFAHLWLPTFMFLRAYESFANNLVIGKPSIHALFTGALGLFSICIMSRASLGHTGREIEASIPLKIAFVCVFVGAVLRVFVPLLTEEIYNTFLHVSMGIWTLGFVIFVFKFAPYYFSKRADS